MDNGIRPADHPPPGDWRPLLAVTVAIVFLAPAIVLAIFVNPVWGPTGYVAALGPIWLFVHRILTGGRRREDGS